MNNDNILYKQKYLKYKIKYLNLFKQIGSGKEEEELVKELITHYEEKLQKQVKKLNLNKLKALKIIIELKVDKIEALQNITKIDVDLFLDLISKNCFTDLVYMELLYFNKLFNHVKDVLSKSNEFCKEIIKNIIIEICKNLEDVTKKNNITLDVKNLYYVSLDKKEYTSIITQIINSLIIFPRQVNDIIQQVDIIKIDKFKYFISEIIINVLFKASEFSNNKLIKSEFIYSIMRYGGGEVFFFTFDYLNRWDSDKNIKKIEVYNRNAVIYYIFILSLFYERYVNPDIISSNIFIQNIHYAAELLFLNFNIFTSAEFLNNDNETDKMELYIIKKMIESEILDITYKENEYKNRKYKYIPHITLMFRYIVVGMNLLYEDKRINFSEILLQNDKKQLWIFLSLHVFYYYYIVKLFWSQESNYNIYNLNLYNFKTILDNFESKEYYGLIDFIRKVLTIVYYIFNENYESFLLTNEDKKKLEDIYNYYIKNESFKNDYLYEATYEELKIKSLDANLPVFIASCLYKEYINYNNLIEYILIMKDLKIHPYYIFKHFILYDIPISVFEEYKKLQPINDDISKKVKHLLNYLDEYYKDKPKRNIIITIRDFVQIQKNKYAEFKKKDYNQHIKEGNENIALQKIKQIEVLKNYFKPIDNKQATTQDKQLFFNMQNILISKFNGRDDIINISKKMTEGTATDEEKLLHRMLTYTI
jgi:hypothetical protein